MQKLFVIKIINILGVAMTTKTLSTILCAIGLIFITSAFISQEVYARIDARFKGICEMCGNKSGEYFWWTNENGQKWTIFFPYDNSGKIEKPGHVTFTVDTSENQKSVDIILRPGFDKSETLLESNTASQEVYAGIDTQFVGICEMCDYKSGEYVWWADGNGQKWTTFFPYDNSGKIKRPGYVTFENHHYSIPPIIEKRVYSLEKTVNPNPSIDSIILEFITSEKSYAAMDTTFVGICNICGNKSGKYVWWIDKNCQKWTTFFSIDGSKEQVPGQRKSF